MNSCDTFVLTPEFNVYGCNVLSKNSDRPIGEAQPLLYTPAQDFGDNSSLKCTYIEIPQVQHTYATIGSRPYWMWGFEMGVNEKAVFIANEAQGSRIAEQGAENELLGMDLLRLGLERAASAEGAVDVISALLERYGQNANASQLFDRRYENSFFIADPNEIWLLETAGRRWIARRVTEKAAISNCYTIEGEYDKASTNIEKYARDSGFLAEGEAFNFAKAYTAPAMRQTIALPRWRRLKKLISEHRQYCLSDIRNILRDHYEGEIIAPRDGWGAGYGMMASICMHAMTWDSSQTTASMTARYDADLGVVVRYAPSIPCCSLYLPVYMTGYIPRCMSVGDKSYDGQSLWWRFERLAIAVSADYESNHRHLAEARDRAERIIEQEAAQAEAAAAQHVKKGEKSAANATLNICMDKCVSIAEDFIDDVYSKISIPHDSNGNVSGYRKEFLSDYCRRTGMRL